MAELTADLFVSLDGFAAGVDTGLELGLVDRLRLMIFPLTLGDAGREFAYAGYPRADLELAASTVLDRRLALLEYRPPLSA